MCSIVTFIFVFYVWFSSVCVLSVERRPAL